jgi:hypothetical protein
MVSFGEMRNGAPHGTSARSYYCERKKVMKSINEKKKYIYIYIYIYIYKKKNL